MRVAKVEAIPVAYPEPNDFNATRNLCLVKVTDDDGRVGWGESVTMWPEASYATRAIVEGMAELVVGTDPTATDATWHRLKQHAWWYGYGGGVASFAVAAIDIALWDLKGKILERSVVDLLGGPVHSRLPAVASAHGHHESIAEMAEEALGWLSSGLQGMKVGFGKRGNARLGYEIGRDIEYVCAMRKAIGPDRLLMIDCGVAVEWDLAGALKRTQAFDDYDVHWIEEPLGSWDPHGYSVLRQNTRCLIAYGEKEWTVAGYERLLDTGTVDVVGVDPGRAEGITGFRKVADRVHAHRRQVNAHAWSSAIVSAASLAISFNSPASKLFELKPLRNPMQHDLVTVPLEHSKGWVTVPTEPGLGIEVIEEVVEQYRIN